MNDLFSTIVDIAEARNRMRSQHPDIGIEVLSRATDPKTSHEAARKHQPKANSNARRVLDAVKKYPDSTACELGQITGLGHIEAQRRLSDLARNFFVEKGNPKQCNIKTTRMMTWRIL
tara:strand:+ start:616 stop:969 length:354 start_codon:yes stop_codon:yes gene_type:complete